MQMRHCLHKFQEHWVKPGLRFLIDFIDILNALKRFSISFHSINQKILSYEFSHGVNHANDK